MVYVWYPARSSRGTKSAALLPGAAAIDRSSGAAQMKDAVFTAYTAGSFKLPAGERCGGSYGPQLLGALPELEVVPHRVMLLKGVSA